MKRLAATFLLSLLVHLALAQWIIQPRVTTADLYQIRFTDRNNGWALGQYYGRSGINVIPANNSSMLKTTDGGNSWSERVLNNCCLWGLTIVNRSVGWAVGRTPGVSGLICKTSDGGDTWNVVDTSAARSHFYSIQFLDEMHGWIGGWNDTTGFVLRTTNGGATWQTTYDKSLDVNELFFWDETHGWNVGENGTIYRTFDGGATWIKVFQVYDASGLVYEPLRRIRFADWLHGCAVGGISGIEVKVWTSDGGLTWNVVRNSPGIIGSSLHGAWFTDANNGWCVGGVNAGLTIQKTTDGGKSWVKQQFPAALSHSVAYFEDIVFVSANEGWIVADSGYILKTTNGGEQPSTLISNRNDCAALEFQLRQNYPNPFNPTTIISFSLPSESFVTLKVFDALGREVSNLLAEKLPAGFYSRSWNASGFPSGVYYYRLRNDSFNETKKFVLIR